MKTIKRFWWRLTGRPECPGCDHQEHKGRTCTELVREGALFQRTCNCEEGRGPLGEGFLDRYRRHLLEADAAASGMGQTGMAMAEQARAGLNETQQQYFARRSEQQQPYILYKSSAEVEPDISFLAGAGETIADIAEAAVEIVADAVSSSGAGDGGDPCGGFGGGDSSGDDGGDSGGGFGGGDSSGDSGASGDY